MTSVSYTGWCPELLHQAEEGCSESSVLAHKEFHTQIRIILFTCLLGRLDKLVIAADGVLQIDDEIFVPPTAKATVCELEACFSQLEKVLEALPNSIHCL